MFSFGGGGGSRSGGGGGGGDGVCGGDGDLVSNILKLQSVSPLRNVQSLKVQQLDIHDYVTPTEPTNDKTVAEFLDVLSSQMEEEGSF